MGKPAAVSVSVFVGVTVIKCGDWLNGGQVRGTVTVKPRPPASSGTPARLGCGTDSGGVRRVLLFNVSGTRGSGYDGGEASLTLHGLAVEGSILQVFRFY